MKTVQKVLLVCITILLYTNISFSNVMTQTSYRWRNDDGDVYSAKWKDSVNTPLILTGNNNIRLRIEFKTDDTVTANFSLGYKEDHYNKPWIRINRSDEGRFILSPSDYISDLIAYSDNDLLPYTNASYNYKQTITFDSSESYYTKLSGKLLYEFEYSIKPLMNIKPASAYFFSILRDGRPIGLDEEAVLLTPPVSWLPQSFGAKYYSPKSNPLDYFINDISFIDANIGTAVGGIYREGVGNCLILRTTDGGITWTEQTCSLEGLEGRLSAVRFTNADVGTAVGLGGIILRTTNGGKDWIRRMSGLTYDFNSISFINADTGLVIGSSGQNTLVLRTLNGGKDWEQFLLLYNNVLNAVQLVNAKTGYMVGQSGTVLKTTDGGQSWNAQSSGTTRELSDIYFTDVNNGYIVGTGIILRTTDGGNKWLLSFDNYSIPLYSIHFINENTGWAVGSDGMIIKTTDGGLNWSILPICTLHQLKAVQFIDEKTGWVLGNNNKIFKTTTGGVATLIDKNKNENIPKNYYLSQNYPNPFNPSTTIQYTLAKPGYVSLEVYDVLGRLINIIFNKYQTEGDYKINWSAKDLPSGIYFYKLRSGEYIETKKMLLIR
ncbi:MAG: YCF48-related protein [Bacteroidota bacterium]|nr:YCF48-related protein [Bacteroidota bacterium]